MGVGAEPIGVAAGEGSIWVVSSEFRSGGDPALYRVDPQSDEVVATIPLGAVPLEVAVGEGAVWVSNSEDDTVTKIDPADRRGRRDDRRVRGARGHRGRRRLGLGRLRGRRAWSGGSTRSRDRLVSEVDVGLQPRFALVAADSVWVSNYLDSTITRIDPVTEKVLAEIDLQPGPQIMLEVGGSIWVSCTDFGAVQRIDPATNAVSEPITHADRARRARVRRGTPSGSRRRTGRSSPAIDPATAPR